MVLELELETHRCLLNFIATKIAFILSYVFDARHRKNALPPICIRNITNLVINKISQRRSYRAAFFHRAAQIGKIIITNFVIFIEIHRLQKVNMCGIRVSNRAQQNVKSL